MYDGIILCISFTVINMCLKLKRVLYVLHTEYSCTHASEMITATEGPDPVGGNGHVMTPYAHMHSDVSP